MKKQTLHEAAKFLAGLVLGDFLGLWWFSAAGLFPVNLFGITWGQGVVWPGLIFDFALFIFLIHYAWNVGKIPKIRERNYLAIIGVIFLIVALVHLLRIFFGGLDINLFGWNVPVWLSFVGSIFASILSYMSFRLRTHLK